MDVSPDGVTLMAYLSHRIGQSIVVLLLLTFIVFTIINLSGDPVRLLLPPDATQEDVQALRTAWGLDDPLLLRYGRFLTQLVRLDFGRSLQLRQPALELVLERLPTTLTLAGLSILGATLIGLPAGILAATKRGSISDKVVSSLALLGQSTPVFWLGIMGILLFAVRLGWLPASGQDTWRHWVLPIGTLSIFLAGGIVRITRTSVLEVISQPFVRTARAKGVLPRVVTWKHILAQRCYSHHYTNWFANALCDGWVSDYRERVRTTRFGAAAGAFGVCAGLSHRSSGRVCNSSVINCGQHPH